MTEELGLQVPDGAESTLLRALIMFTAFALFGALPILGYVATAYFAHADARPHTPAEMMVSACVVTSVTLVGLGAIKSHFGPRRYLRSALETLVLGGVCASLSYNVGLLVASMS